MRNQGFTLFIALVIVSTIMIVGYGLVNLATKQSIITSSARDSAIAFYVADTGMECALYWDVANPTGQSAFSTTAGGANTVTCGSYSTPGIGHGGPNYFWLNFPGESGCGGSWTKGLVVVTKSGSNTTIESYGHNTCLDSTRKVERAVRATLAPY